MQDPSEQWLPEVLEPHALAAPTVIDATKNTVNKIVSTFVILLNDCFNICFTPFSYLLIQFLGCLFVDSHFFYDKCTRNLVQVRKFYFANYRIGYLLIDDTKIKKIKYKLTC